MSGNGWWSRAWSAGGNAKVAPATATRPHRPRSCRDKDCPRPPCFWYRDGYEDGYDDGFADGAASAKE